jgi:hypothetical protein
MRGIEYSQIRYHMFIQFHDGSLVTATITIVRSRENRDYLFLMRPIIALSKKDVKQCEFVF